MTSSDLQWFLQVAGNSDTDVCQPLFELPPEEIQIRTTGRSGVPILKDGYLFWKFLEERMKVDGMGVTAQSKILDFGCAWGRILRFWMRDISPENLYGWDISNELLTFAKSSLPECNFQKTHVAPGVRQEVESFDLIYSYSVFSHLPKKLADSWIQEFARLLKPGGLLAITTRPRNHILIAGSDLDKTEHSSLYREIMVDRNSLLANYDSGYFTYVPFSSNSAVTEETYGEAMIPGDYAKINWTDLDYLKLYENYSESYLQPCFILRKS